MADRLFWPSWFVAAALAGVVTGFMLGRALILGRFLDLMLARGAAVIAAVCGAAWVVVLYASGFAAPEAGVLRSTTGVTRDLGDRVLTWNAPIRFFHAGTLAAALGALLSVPLSASRQRR